MGEVKARLEVIINYQCLGKVGRSIKPIICGGEAEIRGETKPLLTFFIAYPIVVQYNASELEHLTPY